MKHIVDDVRIKEIKELSPPGHLVREFPVTERAAETTFNARTALHRILHGADDRLVVVVGPCSIHDVDSAMEYAARLNKEAQRLQADLQILMRVYFEKPRTTVGWKGLINDPELDGSFKINEGLRIARKLLWEINEMGLPCGTEFLDVITPQYTADLISWGAIGARTTESQIHRELASGISCPIGFKNGTDGNIRIAVDAIKAAASPHHFLSVTKAGHSAIVSTHGNEDCHLILRGGKQPNFDASAVDAVSKELANAGLPARVMIDFSHANSRKEFKRQIEVAQDCAAQLANGEERIFGVMIESNIKEGRQDILPGKPLHKGVSVTDACIGWEDTVHVLDMLADGVRKRRLKLAER
ncbi:MAG: 3-deoxy-7-phosphoheptulonate synthase AroG [Sideroxydans sp.]|nr:3-deoxy-7-phosphoheptulonate synthase AroG [Sideroxydans sp.]